MSSDAKHTDTAEPPPHGAGKSAGLTWPVALTPLDSLADNAINIPLLVKQLRTPVGVVPFVGAGMSVPLGFPAWKNFLEDTAPCAMLRQRVVDLLAHGQYEEAAEALLVACGEKAFQAALEHTFGPHRLPQILPATAVLQLPRLCSGPVLTTNFDAVLEKVFENARRAFEDRILGMNVKALRGAFDQCSRVLVKLHGDAVDQNSRVLTRSDYARAYGDQEPLKAVLRFVMQARPLLFLGCSLENDRTVRVLEALAKDLRGQKAGDLLAHYAVVEQPREDAVFKERHQRLKQLGILPIWYPAGEHNLIAELLAYLGAVAGHEPVCGQVPREPLHYLVREEEVSALRASLVDGDATSVAITGQGMGVGVQGMGGVGKTVLVAAVTRDPDVQRAFPDGIFWLNVGVQPRLLAVMNQLASCLPECTCPLTSESAAQSVIRQALARKRALLILDDVWHIDHAAALNLVSAPGRLLVTTRKRDIIVGLGAREFCVDVLSFSKSEQMLADWAGVKEPAMLPPQAADVARECGRLPLALAMIGAMVQLRPTAWSDALELLRSRELEEFRRVFPDYPYPDLLRAIAVSVDELPPDDRERYLDLAVFPEDEAVPEGPLGMLWSLAPAKTRACMNRLVTRSLATVHQVGGNAALQLHDLQGDYIRKQREKQLPALHSRLLDAYAARCELRGPKSQRQSPCKWAHGPNDGYFFQRLPWQLKQACREKELYALLLDFNWLQTKLEAIDLFGLIDDYKLCGNQDAQLAQHAISLSAKALGIDPLQLGGQILGRLAGLTEPKLKQLCRQACAWRGATWLRPMNSNLHPPGTALLRILTGHTDRVNAVAMQADGRQVVSASRDGSIRVWDVESGRELRILRRQVSSVNTVALSADGRQAIGNSEREIILWDVEGGLEVRTLKGCRLTAESVALSPDGRKAVCASNRGFTVWDVQSGRVLQSLRWPSGRFDEVALSADGHWAVLVPNKGRPEFWDVESGRKRRRLQGHADSVKAVALSVDGHRAVIVNAEGEMIVLDMESGRKLQVLQGHSHLVNAVALSVDGRRAVVGNPSGEIHVWDLESGRKLRILQSHAGSVNAVALSVDGRRVAAGYDDKTVKVWDLGRRRNPRALNGHVREVNAVAVIADGQSAVSVSADETVKVWDMETRRELRTLYPCVGGITAIALSAGGRRAVVGGDSLECNVCVCDVVIGRGLQVLNADGKVNAVALSADGRRAITGNEFGDLEVWDLREQYDDSFSLRPTRGGLVDEETHDCINIDYERRTIRGDLSSVCAVALSADGRRAVSVSEDGAVTVWNVETGRQLRTLKCHAREIRTVALSADGRRALSGSDDGSVTVWDVEAGRELRTLKCHAGEIRTVALSADGRQAVSGGEDCTLKVWDMKTEECRATFTGESVVVCCAIAPDDRTIIVGEQSGRLHFLELVLADDPVEQFKAVERLDLFL